MKSNHCYFVVDGKRCSATREQFSTFCSEHSPTFVQLDNRQLIQQAAEYFPKVLYVTEEKKLGCSRDMVIWGNFNNYLNELAARGYSPREGMNAVGTHAYETGLLDELYQQIGVDSRWKKFEKIVAGIHKLSAEGAEVTFNDKIIGKRSRRTRQIDISIRFRQTFYDYLAIIECKDYEAKVSIEKVEAFRTKIEDVGAMKGIMVSASGFQEGAIRSAEAFNIELFTLTEVRSDWTRVIKADAINLPFPTEITLDHPTLDSPQMHVEPHHITWGKMLFYKDATSPPIPLSTILADVCKWALRAELKLPAIVDVPFESALLTKFPGLNIYTPVYGMKVTLEDSRFAVGRELDEPPRLVKYVYADVARERVHEIPASAVPTE